MTFCLANSLSGTPLNLCSGKSFYDKEGEIAAFILLANGNLSMILDEFARQKGL